MSDLFISYAHEDDAFVARLEAALVAAGRDVWLDKTGIEPADRWRTSAHEAIERSDALLFVISVSSLRSQPCLGELDHATGLNKRVIPVCVDQAAVEMDKPAVLAERSWIMLRSGDDFEAGMAAIGRALDVDLEVVRTHTRILVRAKAWELAGRRASPLLRGDELKLAEQWLARAAGSGSPPTELQQDFIAASHRAATRRLRILAGVATVVAVVAVGLSIFAFAQRSRAIQQASLATSRQLAAVSEGELASNLDVALLLAVQAYRTNPNPQTRSALLQADLYSPRLTGFLSFGATVTALAGSDDRSTVVAGLADGRVMRRVIGVRNPAVLGFLGRSVSTVAVSANGQTVAAANGTQGLLWHPDGRLTRLTCPVGQSPDAVGISPSGATVVVHCRAPVPATGQSVQVLDGATGSVRAVHLVTTPYFFPTVVVVSSDTQVLLFDSTYGPWEQRQIPGWALRSSSPATRFGVHQSLPGYSSDGRFVTVSNNAPTIPVWPTSAPASGDPSTAPLTAQAPISAASALTVSPGGTELAVADSGTIYVAPTVRAGAPGQSPAVLAGNGAINRDALRFVGDGAHLVSAAGSTVALWNLTQFDRLARGAASNLPSPCNGCSGALAAVSPDGRRLAAVADGGNYALIQGLESQSPPQLLTGYDFGPPLWDHGQLLLPSAGSGSLGAARSRFPADVHVLAPARSGESIIAAALTDQSRRVIVVDAYGNVYTQNARTGRVITALRGPRDLRTLTSIGLSAGMAAIDGARGQVAIVDNGVARLTDAGTGKITAHLPGSDAAFVAFTDRRLLVQRTDGSLDVWNATATVRMRVIAGDQSYGFFFPVPEVAGNLVARQRSDGSVTLTDLSSGATLASLPPPASASLELRLGLAFAPGGQSLVTVAQTVAGTTPEIIQRSLSDRSLVRAACATAGRNLSPAEWRTYVGTNPPGDIACR